MLSDRGQTTNHMKEVRECYYSNGEVFASIFAPISLHAFLYARPYFDILEFRGCYFAAQLLYNVSIKYECDAAAVHLRGIAAMKLRSLAAV